MAPRRSSTPRPYPRSLERVAWSRNPRRKDEEDEIYRVVERQ